MPEADIVKPSFWRRLPVAGLFLIMLSPFTLTAFAFWMSSESWEFQGGGVRYWLLVKGSRLDRLGFVAATSALPLYSVQLQEGTDPGSSFVQYESRALPAEIVATYAGRCREMGFKIRRLDPNLTNTNALDANLQCKIESELEAKVWTERKVGASTTTVSVIVWGSE